MARLSGRGAETLLDDTGVARRGSDPAGAGVVCSTMGGAVRPVAVARADGDEALVGGGAMGIIAGRPQRRPENSAKERQAAAERQRAVDIDVALQGEARPNVQHVVRGTPMTVSPGAQR